jgi:8-oxo-dGTP diphosphatase
VSFVALSVIARVEEQETIMKKPQTEQPIVTVDVVLTTYIEGEQYILLIERGKEPFKGQWALPGGKLATCDRTLEDAARREVREETGLSVKTLLQARSYGNAGRDPRGRYISVAFFAPVFEQARFIQAGDDATVAEWFPISALPKLAFDHATILSETLHMVPFLDEWDSQAK